jgi:AcrR family transcriptional regulator
MQSTAGQKLRGRGRPRGGNAKALILSGAVKAFAEFGFHDCSVEKILTASGVSRTNFYRVFKNKEQVFDAVVNQGLRNIDTILASAFRESELLASDEEKIECVLSQYLRACFASGPMVTVMNQREYTSPQYRRMRDASLENIRREIARLMVYAGHDEPNPLMLEGTLAAIDQVIVLVYRQERSSAKRFQVAFETIMPMIEAFAELSR